MGVERGQRGIVRAALSNLTAEKRTAGQSFNPGIAQLYSKAWSAELLRKALRGKTEIPRWLCSENEVGTAVDPLEGALAAVAKIRARGHHKIVVKEALGLAGSNAMRLFEPELLESHRRWLANAVAGGRQLVVEPWLERETDFSLQLEMTADGLRLCGYTGLINDAKGQFQANFAMPGYQKKIPAQVLGVSPNRRTSQTNAIGYSRKSLHCWKWNSLRPLSGTNGH